MFDPIDSGSIAATIIGNAKTICTNDLTATLSGHSLRQKSVKTTSHGALVVTTGKFTGRSATDKFIVKDAATAEDVWWDNTNALSKAHFDGLLADMLAHLADAKVFRQQLFAGANPENRYSVDVWTPSAWHALFIRSMLIRPLQPELHDFVANVSVVHTPEFMASPDTHGSKSSTVIALDFGRNIILICGTAYAGEIKKAVFSLFNYHAPEANILPMHCSANVGEAGDSALFFGLSGTGKTTLSTSASRALVGDDEHGWGPHGIFNLEGGCYAKAINLREDKEPEIFAATRHVGAIMENVVVDPVTGEPDFFDANLTENTRIAYPLTAIPNRVENGMADAPQNVVLLTADAFGVLPPIAKLNATQAVYYFLSGYTAKVAGTEHGVTTPVATFSACFGAPFMARHPADYGRLLAQRLAEGPIECWLINTGWTGGPYGTGQRIDLNTTRRMLDAALSGELDKAEFRTDPHFDLSVPVAVRGVESELLRPELTWRDPAAFQQNVNKLVALFEENFQRLGPRASELVTNRPFRTVAA